MVARAVVLGWWALSGLAPAAALAEPGAATNICVSAADAVAPESLDCLNQELRLAADAAGQAAWSLDHAREQAQPGSGPAMGIYNQSAQRLRMGNAFGHSIYPERPDRVFVSPLISNAAGH